MASSSIIKPPPNNDVARAMFYLFCSTTACGLDILPRDLVDYENYTALSPSRKQCVLLAVNAFSPSVMNRTTLYEDTSRSILSRRERFRIIPIHDVPERLHPRPVIRLRGTDTSLLSIVVHRPNWPLQLLRSSILIPAPLSQVSLNSMSSLSAAALVVALRAHCIHCVWRGPCQCSTFGGGGALGRGKGGLRRRLNTSIPCSRSAHATCAPFPSNLWTHPNHCAHCIGHAGPCKCPHGCSRPPDVSCFPVSHDRCMECGREHTAVLKCTFPCCDIPVTVCQPCFDAQTFIWWHALCECNKQSMPPLPQSLPLETSQRALHPTSATVVSNSTLPSARTFRAATKEVIGGSPEELMNIEPSGYINVKRERKGVLVKEQRERNREQTEEDDDEEDYEKAEEEKEDDQEEREKELENSQSRLSTVHALKVRQRNMSHEQMMKERHLDPDTDVVEYSKLSLSASAFGIGQDALAVEEFASTVHEYGRGGGGGGVDHNRHFHEYRHGLTGKSANLRPFLKRGGIGGNVGDGFNREGRWGSGALGLRSSGGGGGHGKNRDDLDISINSSRKPMSASANLAPRSSRMRRMMRSRGLDFTRHFMGRDRGRDAPFTKGDRVILCGMDQLELDGVSGIVMVPRARAGRAGVCLDRDKTIVNVKYDNLKGYEPFVEVKQGRGREVRFQEG